MTTLIVNVNSASVLALLAASVFFLSGLLTGVWKYLCIMQSTKAEAPYYVNIAHRTSLMYAFAALLLAVLAGFSVWSERVNVWAVFWQLLFFAAAILSYILHGVLRDTDNQLAHPHKLGAMTLPGVLIQLFMWALIAAELGGFVVLMAGVWQGLWPLL